MLKNKDFREMDKLALEFLSDYNLFSFPLDVSYIITNILHAEIICYSELTEKESTYIKEKALLLKGFTIIEKLSDESIRYKIYVNDFDCIARQRFTLAHEIKHILLGEESFDTNSEILADYFAKALLAPKCLILYKKLFSVDEISINFGLSFEASTNWLNAINNRINVLDMKLLDFEQEFIYSYLRVNKK